MKEFMITRQFYKDAEMALSLERKCNYHEYTWRLRNRRLLRPQNKPYIWMKLKLGPGKMAHWKLLHGPSDCGKESRKIRETVPNRKRWAAKVHKNSTQQRPGSWKSRGEEETHWNKASLTQLLPHDFPAGDRKEKPGWKPDALVQTHVTFVLKTNL